MTRIIAGAAGSIKLSAAAKATRPTSDRVKESLFQKLEHLELLENAVVLDLFAGTGALGLEAASRGAKEVQFVERDRQAFELLQGNIEKVRQSLHKAGSETKLEAYQKPADKFLFSNTKAFDLVFVDPPYELDSPAILALLEKLLAVMAQGGVVVLERSSKSKETTPPEFELVDQKTYGDTAVSIYEVRSGLR